MAGKEPDLGSSARTVAENVLALRESQNMNYTQLSDRLKAVADWSINAVGIRRIEAGERRVTPDDLVALALALGVSPITLLMPVSATPDTPVGVTGVSDVHAAKRVWEWLRAEEPLVSERGHTWVEFNAASWPEWDKDRMVEKLDEKKRRQREHLQRRREEKRKASDGDD